MTPLAQKQTNLLVVRNACRTCCLLNDHERDVETSKDLVLDEEGLEIKKEIQIKFTDTILFTDY